MPRKNVKKIISTTKSFILIFCILISVITPKYTSAFTDYKVPPLTDYKVLVQLPGIGDGNTPGGPAKGYTNLNTWLPAAFNLTVAIAVAMAFVMITFGGIMYATSDAITGKAEGRKYLENALVGLLFVIGSYVILYTINPEILKINLSINSPQPLSSTNSVTAGINPSTKVRGSNLTDIEVQALLGGGRISWKPICKPGTSSNCVSFNGLQMNAINGIKGLQATCNCDILITGGTEGAHTPGSDHYKGIALDFLASPAINTALLGPNPPSKLPACFIPVPRGPTVGAYLWEPKGFKCGGQVASGDDHWHVSY